MHQLAGREHPPAALPVEFLRRDHHRGRVRQVRRVHRRGRAAHVQPGPGWPRQDVQRVLVRVAQRPQLARRRDDRVQGRDRQVRRDPRRRGRDPDADVTAVRVGLLGDQREVPLRVGVAQHQVGVRAQLRLQPGERAKAPVVGHDAALHPERVGVTHRPTARRRPTDVRHERRGLGLPGGPLELLVAEGRLGLLVQHDPAVRAEVAQPRPVHVAAALHLQRIRGVEQPERRPDPAGARGQPE